MTARLATRFTPHEALHEIASALGYSDGREVVDLCLAGRLPCPGICAKCRSVVDSVALDATHEQCDECGRFEIRSALMLLDAMRGYKRYNERNRYRNRR